MKTVITVAVIAAGLLSESQVEIQSGQTLADRPDEVADRLIAEGLAKDVAAEQPPRARGKTVRARVLVDGPAGKINDVVELPADEAKVRERAGEVDTDKAAVAYALSLRAAQ